MPPSKRDQHPVVSKQWSCSELVDGNKALLKAKREKDSPATLQKKIEEICSVQPSFLFLYLFQLLALAGKWPLRMYHAFRGCHLLSGV